jgi:hypothetical protein
MAAPIRNLFTLADGLPRWNSPPRPQSRLVAPVSVCLRIGYLRICGRVATAGVGAMVALGTVLVTGLGSM